MKKNNKAKGLIYFFIALIAIILLIYFTQGSNLGKKITITGSSADGKGTIQELIGFSREADDGAGGTITVYDEETKIVYICVSDDGIGYVLKKGSTNKVESVTSSCDYYFNFITDDDISRLSSYVESYNNYVRTRNALAINADNQWALITQDSMHVGTSWFQTLLPYFSVIVVIIVGYILIKSILGANSKSFNFGKTKAQIAHNVKVHFSDVAGIDEEKEELQEVVEFLKNPQKFTDLGAKIPKGILLVGLPGTGKTLLAKAIAGESNVPFFSISGSDFVEMFVGVGASRVRDLFEQAKKEAPCIVFIDEIDAVGRQRGAGLGGGNDEREQTLNQLLVQMDGFEENTGIIVIAATNRSDVLDPALLRPGRFDRQIYINPPDVKGREMILKIHARNKPIDSSVNFKTLARLTSGFTGADIENLLNESAILAARENKKSITMTDITEGINKVLMGPQKRSRIVTNSDKRLTAFHESGHAVVGKVLEHCDVVQEVSIIPRGMAAGYTVSRPDNDESHMSYNKLMDIITQLLGGRASEDVLIKDISTGAQNDIERATKIARKMVTEWGMSTKLGPINLGSSSEVFIGRDYQTQNTYSENTASEIDSEMKSIVEHCYERAKDIIKKHVKEINTMVEVLLEKETIYFNEIDSIMKGKTSKQILVQMEKDEIRNKEKIEMERAEADLEKTKKEQTIRIKTAEALKNGGVLSVEEVEKVKSDADKVIKQAEEKVEELKAKHNTKKDKKTSAKKEEIDDEKTDKLVTPTNEVLNNKVDDSKVKKEPLKEQDKNVQTQEDKKTSEKNATKKTSSKTKKDDSSDEETK